jgi:hypothetical protein
MLKKENLKEEKKKLLKSNLFFLNDNESIKREKKSTSR